MNSLQKNRKGRLLRTTISPCPKCLRRLDAELVEVDGKVRMRKSCPDHGPFDLPVSRDADFYSAIHALTGPPPDLPEKAREFSEFRDLRGICLDLTQSCNLHCANCFAQANVHKKPDLTVEEIVAMVDGIKGRKPVVFLQGGEPTLHKNLPEIIQALVTSGCVPKLITNGLKLDDRRYVDALKSAGLDWVFLQFDGFDDEVYRAFRGKALLSKKLQALENLREAGLSVLLAVMIEKGHNLDQVGAILEFAFESPCVRQISFLPGSRIGRNSLTGDDEKTEPLDVIEALDRATDGGVTRQDFLRFFRIAKTLNRLTGNPDYKPKSCFYPMVLFKEGGKIQALSRLLSPGFSFHNPGAFAAGLILLKNVARLDNAPKDNRTLWVCIEHFRELATFDILDARHCNKVFLDEKGRYVQSCIYNNLHRH